MSASESVSPQKPQFKPPHPSVATSMPIAGQAEQAASEQGTSGVAKNSKPRRKKRGKRLPLLLLWQLWMAGMIAALGIIGSSAFINLVHIPKTKECPQVLWPFTSVSIRLQCAQVLAETGDRESILQAIRFIQGVRADHPLWSTINRNIQYWAFDLTLLAEEEFQAGNLETAMVTLQGIPSAALNCDETSDRCLQTAVEDLRTTWQAVWTQAEDTYQQAERALLNQDWDQAAAIAAQLLATDNNFWRTTKYRELRDQIDLIRAEGSHLQKAKTFAERGGATNLLAAIENAQRVPADSQLYATAQAAISRYSREMFELAERTLDRKDSSEALAIARKIPNIANLQKEVEDFTILANAQARVWGGDIPTIQKAIADVRGIGADRPLYGKAQQRISRWQIEINDITRLNKARQLATAGNIADYLTAIAEASLVPNDNPRADEAERLIDEWTASIERLQDQPILDRATQLARASTLEAYRAGINEVEKINRGTALYSQAQDYKNDWQAEIERIEDNPYLQEARQLADVGRLTAAISTAQRILPGRSLYGTAQSDIQAWRSELQAINDAQRAQAVSATLREPDFGQSSSPVSVNEPSTSDTEIERWSRQLLQIARERASYDLEGAIDVAQRIPPGTSIFDDAQALIRNWQ
ncbi:MAG: hypothetical protein AAGF24_02550, partial [Cyanobacteria bacterium P01_H01_bin.121]